MNVARLRIGARELAVALGEPEPTDEQVAIIEAPVEPVLVVAGAGSGKTATMTDRVVYLVANDLVEPSEVLGLTFTRKAAGELAERVERRLRAWWRLSGRSAGQYRGEAWEDDVPRISTYHAYAGALVRDHGLRAGVDPDAVLIGAAARYQLAAQTVEAWSGDLDVDHSPSAVTGAVCDLAGELAEHMLDPRDAGARMLALAEQIEGKDAVARKREPYREVAEVIAALRARAALMPVVEAFNEAKRQRGLLDHADQVALAARLARDVPQVRAAERRLARIVLLDEYQDTSVAQLAMLRCLFGDGHPVTAVGDPQQGIYGWRGASAGALLDFPEHFRRADGSRARELRLTTSWRNDEAILAAANRVSQPLRVSPPLRARPGAGRGEVLSAFAASPAEEADVVAEVMRRRWRRGEQSAAVLCRKRSSFAEVTRALAQHDVPFQVVGLAGLLATPHVSDVRAALQAAYDPSRGDALMRLLTGPICALGVADLRALRDHAGDLARRGAGVSAQGTASAEDAASAEDSLRGRGSHERTALRDGVESASIVEALDALPAPGARASSGRRLSEEGRSRLVDLGQRLRTIRSLAHLSMPELVVVVEHVLGLDIEVTAAGDAGARANLDQLAQVAAEFTGSDSSVTLGSFLAWMDAADSHERGLESAPVEPDPALVQVLTIHAAKGLEWDVVAVVGMSRGDFPQSSQKGQGPPTDSGWLTSLSALPAELRGDRDHLPMLDVEGAATHADMRDARAQYRLDAGAHVLAEERRLGYVAFTRARSTLLLTGAWWSSRTTPNEPSLFWREVVAAGLATPVTTREAPSFEELDRAPERNPREAVASPLWPAPPGPGVRSIRAAARLVEAAQPVLPEVDHPALSARAQEWAWQAVALLAEHEQQVAERSTPRETQPLDLAHLSASQVVALTADPARFEVELRRPIPREPSTAARRGSQFHAWVEQHYGAAALLDVDELDGGVFDGLGEESLEVDDAALRRAFLASPWADVSPLEIEVDIETVVAGVPIRCRVDAVFAGPGGKDGPDVQIVDWKTGAPARGVQAVAARQTQLSLYRLAWSRLRSVPLERVAASFHFVGTSQTLDAPMLTEPEISAAVARSLAGVG